MRIPEQIRAFIEAANKHHTEKFLAAISNNAVINDEGHDYHGTEQIRKWAEEKVNQPKVTFEPTKIAERGDKIIVTAKVDGNFDKTGLPDPLLLDLHFTIDSNKVTGLTIKLHEGRANYFSALAFWIM